MSAPYLGHCLCMAVRYRITEEPLTVYACHCTDCQRRTGSALAVSMVVRRPAIQLDQGEPARYGATLSGGRTKVGRLCASCGTRLWGEPERSPGIAMVQTGTLTQPCGLVPVAHQWLREAQPWFVYPRGAALYDTQPDDPRGLASLWRGTADRPASASRGLDQLRLVTARLTLRPLQQADAPALFDIFSDPEVMRYWSTPPWSTLDEARAFITRDLAAVAGGDYIRLGIERRQDRQLLGHCTLFDLSAQSRRAEVGYGLARPVWGQGYMHEALSALLEHGFNAMDLNRVEADIDPRNAGSARSLERLGFIREGQRRERWIVGGEVSDSALFGLLRSDWLARQPAPGCEARR